MLGVYNDGSGRTVMSGCLATVEQWAELERRWSALLGIHGLRYVHAKELRQGTGQFKSWPRSRRSRFAQELFAALTAQSEYFLTVILNNNEFEHHYRSPDKVERKRKGVVDSKYGVCFRVFMSLITQLVDKYKSDEVITITLEAGHKNGGAAETIFAEFKNYSPDLAHIITSVAYVDKKEAFGVQAADLLAYIYFRGVRDDLLSRRVDVDLANVPALTPGLLTNFRAEITPETLKEIREGQITRAQQRRWFSKMEGR